MPCTASVPIEPPGNRSGLTTNESVVSASSTPPTVSAPASAISFSVSLANAGASSPSIRLWVALPPAPWDMLMCVSRNFARFPLTVSMIPRTFASRSETAV